MVLEKQDTNIIDIVNKIIFLNTHLKIFWKNSHGWASSNVSELLESSMLEWTESLSISLTRWVQTDAISDGDLILAWCNLGALVENTLKLFICVYLEDYNEVNSHRMQRYRKEILPNKANLGELIGFTKRLQTGIVEDFEYKSLFNKKDNYNDFLENIQNNRNAIHAFRKRDLDNYSVFVKHIKIYFYLLEDINYFLPYPEEDIPLDIQETVWHLKKAQEIRR
jgi:hypothetical protein